MTKPHLSDADLGLLKNALDSIEHALEHSREDNYRKDDDDFHNRKWIHLSVAHAAEQFCNFLLAQLTGQHPPHGADYPSLSKVIAAIHSEARGRRLPEREVLTLKYLRRLKDARDVLMHRPAPVDIDDADATFALLALLYVVRRRLGITVKQFIDQEPPVDLEVLQRLSWKHQDDWFALAEKFVGFDADPQFVESCSSCGRFSMIPWARCEACFADYHSQSSN